MAASDHYLSGSELWEICKRYEEHVGHVVLSEDEPAANFISACRQLVRVLRARKDLGPPDKGLIATVAGARIPLLHRNSLPMARALNAANDLLVALSKARLTDVDISRDRGYNGQPCPECGQFTVRYKGKCEGCDSCSWQGGCS